MSLQFDKYSSHCTASARCYPPWKFTAH